MKIVITENQYKNLLMEYTIQPFQQTKEVGNRIEYNFNVGDIQYVVTMVGTEDKQMYELGFGVVGKDDFAYRTGKNVEHLNTVLNTVDAIVKDAVTKYRIKKIVFSGARGESDSDIPFIDPIRMKIYFRFLTQKYPNAKYDKGRNGLMFVFMNSIYPEVFAHDQDQKEILLDLIAQLNNDPDAEDDYWRWDNTFGLDHKGRVEGYTDAIINADYGGIYLEIDCDYHYTLKIQLFDTDEEIEETFNKFSEVIGYIRNRFSLN
jgi:hypothetical protein